MNDDRAPSIPIEEREVQGLTFIGEQVGEPERRLKSDLLTLFRTEPTVARAYLAKIMSDGVQGVALCLVTGDGGIEAIVPRIGALFARPFSTAMHLDILDLSAEQEGRLAAVCRPFYSVSSAVASV